MAIKKRVISTKTQAATPSQDFCFTEELIRSSIEPFSSQQKKAYEIFRSLSIPNTKEEAWRRTSLKDLHPETFLWPIDGKSIDVRKTAAPISFGQNKNLMILENNLPRFSLDESISANGIIATDLLTAEIKYPELVLKIKGKVVPPNDGKFAALTHAFSQNGLFIYVPKDTHVSQPLTGLIRMNKDREAFISHSLVFLESGSSLDLFLSYDSPSIAEGHSFHSGILEVIVSPSAKLRLFQFQTLGEHTWHFSHEKARIEKNASIEWITTSLGGYLSKTFATIDLVESGAQGQVSGIYFPANHQHMDLDTQQNHYAPHTASDLLYKGALSGNSRSVWQGMIYVAPGAVKTDGYQANRNLILSPFARADSIPGLEIKTDDVRCTHGATIGKIDPDQKFYLLSRGIPPHEVEKLLIQGFFAQVLERIPIDAIRSKISKEIMKKVKTVQNEKT